MSDYYGTADLKDWLYKEVFAHHLCVDKEEITEDILAMFSPYKEAIERNIEDWMDSDDGYGNNVSWRGWGRGFNAIPDANKDEFDRRVNEAHQLIKYRRNPSA